MNWQEESESVTKCPQFCVAYTQSSQVLGGILRNEFRGSYSYRDFFPSRKLGYRSDGKCYATTLRHRLRDAGGGEF